jgi:hypothetical protein
MIIFKIENISNGKIFIGYSRNDNPNNLGSGKYIKAAVNKFGVNNFKREVIEEFNDIVSISTVLERYEYWINKYKSDNPRHGYNESVQEAILKPKRLTKKIQVLLTPEDEDNLNSIIIQQAMEKNIKPTPISRYVRNLVLEHISKELTPDKIIK